MTKKCIPLCRPTVNGSITLWERKWSSAQTTDPYCSYRHKESCRAITIRNGPPTYNSSIWTLSIRRETPIMLLIANRPPVMVLIIVHDSCGHETLGWPHLYKSDPEFDNMPDAHGREASSKFSPSRCMVMPPRTHLYSFKRACQDDLEGAL